MLEWARTEIPLCSKCLVVVDATMYIYCSHLGLWVVETTFCLCTRKVLVHIIKSFLIFAVFL